VGEEQRPTQYLALELLHDLDSSLFGILLTLGTVLVFSPPPAGKSDSTFLNWWRICLVSRIIRVPQYVLAACQKCNSDGFLEAKGGIADAHCQGCKPLELVGGAKGSRLLKSRLRTSE